MFDSLRLAFLRISLKLRGKPFNFSFIASTEEKIMHALCSQEHFVQIIDSPSK